MEICHRCGEEIVFRYVGGCLIPIHINGGTRSERNGRIPSSAVSNFKKVDSYLAPNARCPVCRKTVFFYRSPHNGRVFFDDVGWPWPKHPCTDKYRGRDEDIQPAAHSRFKFHFRGRDDQLRDIYFAREFTEKTSRLLVRVDRADGKISFWIAIRNSDMEECKIRKDDLAEAPSLVLSRHENDAGEIEVSFLSARLESVVLLHAKRC